MIDEYLTPYVRGAAESLGPGVECSVTLAMDGVLSRATSSDLRAAVCDEVEAIEGAGPCVLAMVQLRGVLVADIAAENRWQPWRLKALELGLRSAVALPAFVARGQTLALNLYSEAVDPWDRQALLDGDEHAQMIAEAVRRYTTRQNHVADPTPT